jgi:hypothetical protein
MLYIISHWSQFLVPGIYCTPHFKLGNFQEDSTATIFCQLT